MSSLGADVREHSVDTSSRVRIGSFHGALRTPHRFPMSGTTYGSGSWCALKPRWPRAYRWAVKRTVSDVQWTERHVSPIREDGNYNMLARRKRLEQELGLASPQMNDSCHSRRNRVA